MSVAYAYPRAYRCHPERAESVAAYLRTRPDVAPDPVAVVSHGHQVRYTIDETVVPDRREADAAALMIERGCDAVIATLGWA